MNQTAPFDKQPKTNSELADLLISRGLAADKPMVEHLLDSVGYYRLTGYLAPFKDRETKKFLSGTNLERQPSFTYTTTFTLLSLCAYCMGIIRPESKWKNRCRDLLKTATPFILRGMGAPADWETLALWQ